MCVVDCIYSQGYSLIFSFLLVFADLGFSHVRILVLKLLNLVLIFSKSDFSFTYIIYIVGVNDAVKMVYIMGCSESCFLRY